MAYLEILPERVGDHRAVQACCQVMPEWRDAASIEVLQLQSKSAVYRLARATAGGPTLIAKRCRAACARHEWMIYEDFIAHLPAPALRCLGCWAEADGENCWLFLEDAGGAGYLPASEAHRVLAGQWLAGIQVAAALKSGLAARLPNREPDYYLKLLQSSREILRTHYDNPALPAQDARMLEGLVEDCDALDAIWDEVEAICLPAPRTLVHGDFVVKNVRVQETARGPALWGFDWEHANWGVPAADLAQFTGHSVSPDLETCAAVWREHWPEAENLDPHKLAECGRFFRLLTAIGWVSPGLTFRPYRFLAHPVSLLRVYQARLHEALRTTPWMRTSVNLSTTYQRGTSHEHDKITPSGNPDREPVRT